MNLQLGQFRVSLRAILWAAVALVLLGATTAPAHSTALPAVTQNAAQQVTGATATVTAHRAAVWSGPGRGFWFLGTVLHGGISPVLGISADKLWIQVSTTAGTGFFSVLDATLSVDKATLPVIDPGPIGVVTAGRVVVRKGPGLEAASVGSAARGMEFFILGTSPDGGWLQIHYRFGTGWISASLAHAISGKQDVVGTVIGEPTAIANAGALNIRTGPGFIFASLGTVKGGTAMLILGKSHDGVWLQVKSPFGTGWVNIIHIVTKNYFGGVPVTEDQAAGAATEAIFTVLGGSDNLRSGPGLGFSVVAQVNTGMKLTILGQSKTGWWYVKGLTVQAKVVTGWINKSLGQASGDVGGVPFIVP